jgi:hypothetical protein
MLLYSRSVSQITRCGYETRISITLNEMRDKIESVVKGDLGIHLSGLQTNTIKNADIDELWQSNFSTWKPLYLYDRIHLNKILYHPIPNVSYSHWLYLNKDYGDTFIPLTLNIGSSVKRRRFKIFSLVYMKIMTKSSLNRQFGEDKQI